MSAESHILRDKIAPNVSGIIQVKLGTTPQCAHLVANCNETIVGASCSQFFIPTGGMLKIGGFSALQGRIMVEYRGSAVSIGALLIRECPYALVLGGRAQACLAISASRSRADNRSA
jgi:hypothetical protein